jgi:hypothetical protein
MAKLQACHLIAVSSCSTLDRARTGFAHGWIGYKGPDRHPSGAAGNRI